MHERDIVIAAYDDLVSGLRAQLTTTEIKIEHLKLMIAKLRRMQFGRKFEKLNHQDRTAGATAGRPVSDVW